MKKDNFLHDQRFQLLYLALLTSRKVKPLSRWEKSLGYREKQTLKKFDLVLEPVTRFCDNGKKIDEFVFSTSSRYLSVYTHHFDYKPLRFTHTQRKIEGFLFGYPSCCVENFIHNGYTPNPYIDKEQKLLFHWICPECRISPSLFPLYESIFNECKELYALEFSHNLHSPFIQFFKKALPYAAAVTFSLGTLSHLHADLHWVPVPGDEDNDYLTNSEELITGVFPSGETHTIAQNNKAIIDSLPRGVSANSCYVIEHPAYGFYNCPVCGVTVNMGYVTVHNPMHVLEIDIPYIALHFMEHGSFSYIIEDDTTRIDIALLNKTIAPLDTLHHALATPDDTDNDGLNNTAELYFDMEIDNPYTHDIGIDDGHEISQALIENISKLPVIPSGTAPPTDSIYIEPLLVYGVEDCTICGRTQNMGMAVIHNPIQGSSMTFPFMALHYMSHGRFVYDGTTNQGEIDPIALCVLLDLDLVAIDEFPEIAHKFGYRVMSFPNPFNTAATISFETANLHEVAYLEIYNMKGQKVKELPIANPSQDHQISVTWDGTDINGNAVPSGIYLVKAHTENSEEVYQKIVLVR